MALFWLACIATNLSAAPLSFAPTQLDRQLPQSSVLALAQDSQGFIWVGTREGLSRWSGREVRTWRSARISEAAIPGNIVDQVFEDRYGNIWLRGRLWDRHPTTLAKLDPPNYQSVQTYPEVANGTLFLDANKDVYAALGSGIYKYSPVENKFEQTLPALPDPKLDVVAAVATTINSVFVSLSDGTVFESSTDGYWREIPHEIPSQSRHRRVSLFEDSSGRIWAAATRLAKLDRQSGRFEIVNFPLLPQEPDHEAKMIELANGHILLGTMFGLVEYSPVEDRVTQHHKLDLAGVRDDQQWVIGLLRDANNDIWAGSLWGLQHAFGEGGRLSLLAPTHADGSAMTSTVAGILEHSDGGLWISSFGSGHIRVNQAANNSHTVFGTPAQASWVWMMDELSDGRVVAAESNRLLIADSGGRALLQDIELGDVNGERQTLLGVQVTSDDRIWYLTTHQVGYLDEQSRPIAIIAPEWGESTALAADATSVWIGTTTQLIRIDRKSSQQQVVIDGISVTTLTMGEGDLWVGTPRGLLGVDNTSFAVRQPLVPVQTASSFVTCIVEPFSKELWYTTSRGLVRVDLSSKPAVQFVFDGEQGVGNHEFNRNACTVGQSGRVYFGGNQGVTNFLPREVPLRGENMALAITRMTQRGHERTSIIHGPASGKVIWSPDIHTLDIELSALAMPSSNGVRYATQLEGLNDAWINQGESPVVTYTNLEPGSYTFRAKAQSSQGIWSVKQIAVPIIVQPAYWQTWWFTLLWMAAMVLVPIAFVWLLLSRRYQLRLSAAKALEARDQERLRISRDMHDEIGAGLTEIAIMSELARKDAETDGRQLASSKVKGIGERTRSMLGAMSEIIWATDPRNDDPKRFVAYLREYCGQFFENTELHAEYDFSRANTECFVPADFRRSVLLILKEAINNVVKHAEASHVFISLSLEEGELSLVVRDDGQGDLNGDTQNGHGLANMRDRAISIGGVCKVSSQESGTEVRLRAPLPNPL